MWRAAGGLPPHPVPLHLQIKITYFIENLLLFLIR